jgi:peptide/nickel transport system permease protein
MGRYILGRLVQTIPLLVGITILSFLVINLAPGGPIGMTLNPTASPKVIEQMRKNFHLDEPVHVRYGLWLKDLATGNLFSWKDGKPVMGKILERLPNTIILNVVAMVIMLCLGIPLGVLSAARRGSIFDHLGTVGSYIAISIPSFWLAYLLILASVKLWGYPVLGVRSFAMGGTGFIFIAMDRLWHLMLPSVVLAVGGVAIISRYCRSSLLEVLEKDYIRTARAKGLPEDDVYYRHALKNGLMPIVTLVGFMVPGLISGSVIIETVFAWPGIGRLAYQAVLARDIPVVMTILTISSLLTLLGNLTADVLYGLVDPRVRYGS